jgi:hypothetical protein
MSATERGDEMAVIRRKKVYLCKRCGIERPSTLTRDTPWMTHLRECLGSFEEVEFVHPDDLQGAVGDRDAALALAREYATFLAEHGHGPEEDGVNHVIDAITGGQYER